MDFSKFKTSDWLIVGGGLGMFVFGLFFKWWKVSFGGFSRSGGNAFDFFFTGTVPWLLLVGSAVVVVLLTMDVLKQQQLPWAMILAAATVLAAFLMLLRVLFNFGAVDGVDRGVGMYLSFLSSLAAAAGGVMGYTAAGGDLKDFVDLDKIKAAFDTGAGTTAVDAPPATPAVPPAAPPPPPTHPAAAPEPPPAPPAAAEPAPEPPPANPAVDDDQT